MDRLAYALENLGIALGYGFFAWSVMTVLPIRERTRWAGRAFFALCAATHVEMTVHAVFDLQQPMWTETHSHLVHVLQAVAVWFFAVWFRKDVIDLVVAWRVRHRTTIPPQRRPVTVDPAILERLRSHGVS